LKLRKLEISTHLLAEFLINPVPPGLSSDCPRDLQILSQCPSRRPGMITLIVHSESFSPAPIRRPWDAPVHEIRFTRETQPAV